MSKKIFLIGEESINEEIRTLFGGKADFISKLSDEADIIIDSLNAQAPLKIANMEYIDKHCSKLIPVLTSSLCCPVSELCSISKFPSRLIGIGLYNTFSKAKLIEIAPSKITDENILGNAENFLSETGVSFAKVPDRAGLVFPRIISMIINEAAQVYAEKIAAKEDIDTAMKLGTNYPLGPLEWADKLGVDLVYDILASLHKYYGEDRYRPHPSLREMVNLNMLGVKTGKGFYEYT
ncbi:MAG TPA: 3-hydroxyacyl-CoA dehydrogenase family protein [Ignavibacteria bacterium]|nr:3-hydroxyacyl-CoA dehydrogenase family protein [Ignavibacteria bacterium]